MVKKILQQCMCKHNPQCIFCRGHGLCFNCIIKNNGKDKIHCKKYDTSHPKAYSNEMKMGYYR